MIVKIKEAKGFSRRKAASEESEIQECKQSSSQEKERQGVERKSLEQRCQV
jgi:hypothetical protein